MPLLDSAAARRHMVESQLTPNQVHDPAVIAAMAAVPREAFVGESLRAVAYLDEDLALSADRYLLEPMVLGRLIQEAAPRPGDRALVVGCGTGYGAAILARLGLSVVALECDPDLVAAARANLAPLGDGRVEVVAGALAEGRAQAAPFDVILLAAAVEQVPDALLAQLAGDGRLVTVLRPGAGIGKAMLMERAGETFSRRILFDAATPRLPARIPGFSLAAGFVF